LSYPCHVPIQEGKGDVTTAYVDDGTTDWWSDGTGWPVTSCGTVLPPTPFIGPFNGVAAVGNKDERNCSACLLMSICLRSCSAFRICACSMEISLSNVAFRCD